MYADEDTCLFCTNGNSAINNDCPAVIEYCDFYDEFNLCVTCVDDRVPANSGKKCVLELDNCVVYLESGL